jgi:pyruvate,water dikinase
MVAVNASWGLGLAVVGGEVTPDDFLVSKVTGEVVKQTINDKRIEYVAAADGTERIDVEETRRREPCLDDDKLTTLVAIGKRVEKHFGAPQDIEWAFDNDGELFILQSRPVTGLAHKEAPPATPTSAMSMIFNRFGAGA